MDLLFIWWNSCKRKKVYEPSEACILTDRHVKRRINLCKDTNFFQIQCLWAEKIYTENIFSYSVFSYWKSRHLVKDDGFTLKVIRSDVPIFLHIFYCSLDRHLRSVPFQDELIILGVSDGRRIIIESGAAKFIALFKSATSTFILLNPSLSSILICIETVSDIRN